MMNEPTNPCLLLSFLSDPHAQLSTVTWGRFQQGVYHNVRRMTLVAPVGSAIEGRKYKVIKSFKPQYVSHAGFWEIDDNR